MLTRVTGAVLAGAVITLVMINLVGRLWEFAMPLSASAIFILLGWAIYKEMKRSKEADDDQNR